MVCPAPVPVPVISPLKEVAFWVFLLILALLGIAFATQPIGPVC